MGGLDQRTAAARALRNPHRHLATLQRTEHHAERTFSTCCAQHAALSLSMTGPAFGRAPGGGQGKEGWPLLLWTRLYARRLWKGRFCECVVCTNKHTAKCRPSWAGGTALRNGDCWLSRGWAEVTALAPAALGAFTALGFYEQGRRCQRRSNGGGGGGGDGSQMGGEHSSAGWWRTGSGAAQGTGGGRGGEHYLLGLCVGPLLEGAARGGHGSVSDRGRRGASRQNRVPPRGAGQRHRRAVK